MLEIFETRKLTQSVNQIHTAPSYIIDTFFSNIDVNTAEHIDVEIYDGKRKLAPFVAPKVAGKLMKSEGKTVSSYKPSYIKFKYVTEAEDAARNTDGVFYADSKTPEQRVADKAVRELAEGRNNIMRTVEFMGIEALTQGQVTINGEGITDVVDFQMPSANIKTLTGAALWTEAGSDPIKDLLAWKNELAKNGVAPNKVVMGEDVISAFISNPKVQTYLDNRRIELGAISATDMGDGVTAWANILGMDIVSYSAYYTDENDDPQNMFPSDKLLMGSTMAKTVLNYGAIKDLKSGNFVGEVFAKSWEQEDPSARFVLLQSAPLPVPTQVSAFMTIKAV